MSTSLWPYGLQHTRFPCPPLCPGVCSSSCLLSQWCYMSHPKYANYTNTHTHTHIHMGFFTEWWSSERQCLWARSLHLQRLYYKPFAFETSEVYKKWAFTGYFVSTEVANYTKNVTRATKFHAKILGLPLVCCANLGKWLNLSGPQSSHLYVEMMKLHWLL